MPTRLVVALAGALIAGAGCTRTVYVAVPTPDAAPPAAKPAPAPAPAPEPVRAAPPRESPRPASASTLGIPAGHLPYVGECRVWIPGTPPGRQTYERSRPCDGISRAAPGGSWIVYRPTRDQKLVHVRVTDRDRPGTIVVVHVFDHASGKFLYDESYREPAPAPAAAPRGATPAAGPIAAPAAPRTAPAADPRRTPQERPGPVTDPGPSGGPIPVPPPAAGPIVGATTTQPSPGERRKPEPAQTKDVPLPPPVAAPTAPATRDVPLPPPVLAPVVPGPTSREIPLPPPVSAPDGAPAPRTGPEQPAPASGPAPATPQPAPQPAPNTASLDVPPGHFPDAGQCRVWIPGTPPGRQPQRDSRACAEVTPVAPAGSWVLYRPGDGKGIHVKVVDARRPGVIVAVRIYDDARRFVREEQP